MKAAASLLLTIALATPLAAATSSTSPRTTNNDDSCAVMPAATLLLPYFDVDFKAPPVIAATTLFTVQNVSPSPQIVNMTIWTDWSYPIFDIPIFLTGYDVQSINLYDVLRRGVFAPPSGTSIELPVPSNPSDGGSQPLANTANPNFLASAPQDCAAGRIPGVIPETLVRAMQDVLTLGRANGIITCNTNAGTPAQIGGVHSHAIGYITLDVVATCAVKNPASRDYYSSVLLFDNVLTGDYQNIIPRAERSYALGGPLVHIRAIPEGGKAGGAAVDTSLPYTFYDRLTNAAPSRTFDRRQPLPSTFAPRFVEGGEAGFSTHYRIWREAETGLNASCLSYSSNAFMRVADVIRFDEHENATVSAPGVIAEPPLPPAVLPPVSFDPSTSVIYPPNSSGSGDVAGWLYMNLNNGGSDAYSAGVYSSGLPRDFRSGTSTLVGARQSQNWVITSMFAEPTYAIESTATALGNGCSPSPAVGTQIAPAPNATP